MSTVALVAAFRAADRVGTTVTALLPLVERVVVVDDGSDDGGATAQAARRAGATVVVLPANRGKGGALAAGMAATPEATTYLLVDADTADTAGATAPLLDAVAAGADLAVGVLPPAGGRGGFGTVRTVAARGIRSASGFEPEAPLSGQRAVRATLLRSLEPADRFGVEAGMTIDAVRAGARVVEVPVTMDHDHTGRGVAGFSHRAAQGWDLLRALWPRLLDERARRLLLVAAALVLVGLLAAGASTAVPNGRPLGPADRVVLVAAPAALGLDDLDDANRPELAAVAGRRGAVAAANVDVPGRTAWSTWATVGAGRQLRAEPPTRDPDPLRPFLVQDRQPWQGLLGEALHRAGRTTAFVGSAPTSPVRLAVADGAGHIDRAATAGSIGTAGMVNRARADLNAGAALVAVDATGLDPAGLEDLLAGLRVGAGERELVLLVTPADPAGRFGLRPVVASGPGAPAGRLVSPSTRRNGLVLLTDVGPTVLASLGVPVPEDMVGQPLRRLARDPDIAGLVEADQLSRQRVTVWDPALLAVVPLHFAAYGWAWRRHRRHRARGGGRERRRPAEDEAAATTTDRTAVAAGRDDGRLPVDVDGRAARRHGSSGSGRWLGRIGLGLAAWPLATWIVRALPGSAFFGRWAGLLALAVDALLVAVAWRLGRRRGLAPLALVLGATLALVTLDLGMGGPLQLSSAFGGAAHSAGRFTGLGNPAFAVYAGAALLAVACARRRAPWMVALLVLVALTDALPTLGGDVGGAVTAAPVFALTVAALWGRLSLRAVVLAGLAAAALLAVALAVDLFGPSESRTHLARFATSGGRSSSIGGKVAQNLGTYAAIPALVLVVGIAVGFAVLLWRGHFTRALPPGSPARIGIAAALAVALVGNVVNDSGPIVTLIVMSVIGPYLVVRSVAEEPPPQVLEPLPGQVPVPASS